MGLLVFVITGVLKAGDEAEWEAFVNALTTNLTSFFREKHHFLFLPSMSAVSGMAIH